MRTRSRRPLTAALIAAALAAGGIAWAGQAVLPAASAEAAPSGGAPSGAASCGSGQCPGWIVARSELPALASKANGGSWPLVDTAFGNSSSYVYGAPGTVGIKLVTFQSYQLLKTAFADGKLPGPYQAVMYDNERWQPTPPDEQQHPDKYEHLAANLVHLNHMLFISAPAPDITLAIGKQVNHSTQDTYLNRDLAGGAAQDADIVDIQAQYLEPDLIKFVAFATAAARQARLANPHVKVYIGIATGPGGQTVTAQQLHAAYQAVRASANGYWLNISVKNRFCPTCGAARPQLAVALLKDIYG